ncbi:cytosolic putative serine hydroxymethyltransferase [Geopyxis carbonaria]|nr:cytosolic putative serine hydroxymethyltransferase [Geopyxis carbonaria]
MTYALSQSHKDMLEKSLKETDPEVYDLMQLEIKRQTECIPLIASENITSRSVYDALGSVMSNKYSEGYPGARYYGGNEHIDSVETLCQDRALAAFGLDKEKWGVNVQCLSGSPANLQVYQAIMKPHDRLMGLDLPHGGHLSHGYQIPTRKISAVSTYFETMPYRVNEETGIIDYDMLEKTAALYRPKTLVAGTSAYCREIDYARMRKIADSVGAYLVVDMAHISGLVAAGVIKTPFDHADVVTTTTHKSLRGPRGAMIFFRRGVRSVDAKGKETLYDLENPINFRYGYPHPPLFNAPGSYDEIFLDVKLLLSTECAKPCGYFPVAFLLITPVFYTILAVLWLRILANGGPHNHTITALSVALKQTMTPEFKAYQQQIVKNAKTLEEEFTRLGYKLVSGGTDSHMVLLNLRPQKLDGARVEAILEAANISCNKNAIPGDKSALTPGGVRVGTPAATTRGFGEEDFKRVAQYFDQLIKLTRTLQDSLPKEANKLKDFRAKLAEGVPEVEAIRQEVKAWASTFPLPV